MKILGKWDRIKVYVQKYKGEHWARRWKDECKDERMSLKMKGWVQRWKDGCKDERLSVKMKGWV